MIISDEESAIAEAGSGWGGSSRSYRQGPRCPRLHPVSSAPRRRHTARSCVVERLSVHFLHPALRRRSSPRLDLMLEFGDRVGVLMPPERGRGAQVFWHN